MLGDWFREFLIRTGNVEEKKCDVSFTQGTGSVHTIFT